MEQKQCGIADKDAGINVLIRWLHEPQTGPGEVADIISTLSALAFSRRQTGIAEPRTQNGDDRVDNSLTSSAVLEEVYTTPRM